MQKIINGEFVVGESGGCWSHKSPNSKIIYDSIMNESDGYWDRIDPCKFKNRKIIDGAYLVEGECNNTRYKEYFMCDLEIEWMGGENYYSRKYDKWFTTVTTYKSFKDIFVTNDMIGYINLGDGGDKFNCVIRIEDGKTMGDLRRKDALAFVAVEGDVSMALDQLELQFNERFDCACFFGNARLCRGDIVGGGG